MHTDRAFADVLVRFGELARLAAAHVQSIPPESHLLHTLESIPRALARFFWFTIEFGLMRDGPDIKVYGSGLLSFYGEIEHATSSPDVQRHPHQLEWVINQSFEIDSYQPLLFIANDFEHVFTKVDTLAL